MNWKTISIILAVLAAFGGSTFAVASNTARINQVEKQTGKCYSNAEVLSSIKKDIEWIKKRMEKE